MNAYNRKNRAREFRRAGSMSAQTATDAQALTMPTMFPYWAEKTAYGGEGQPQIVRRPVGGRDQLFRCQLAHTSQAGWEPESTPSLWEYIDVEHAGTMDDPIPAELNMTYYAGKYYSEGEKLYLCTRDSEIPLAYLPSQLVGQYFEEVAA